MRSLLKFFHHMNYTLRIRVYVPRKELPDYPDPFLFISEWDWNPTNFNEPSRGVWIGDIKSKVLHPRSLEKFNVLL